MSNKITPERFLKWAKNNPRNFEELFYDNAVREHQGEFMKANFNE